MPRISHKGETMPSSPIRKLVPYSDAAKQRGIKVYHLNIGQPDIETPQDALKKMQNTGYKNCYKQAFFMELRNAIRFTYC
jgi:aspartate aminotransferase